MDESAVVSRRQPRLRNDAKCQAGMAWGDAMLTDALDFLTMPAWNACHGCGPYGRVRAPEARMVAQKRAWAQVQYEDEIDGADVDLSSNSGRSP